MTELQLLTVLKAFVARHTSQASAARALGVSPAFLSMIVHGHKPISRHVAAQLGYCRRRVTVIERID